MSDKLTNKYKKEMLIEAKENVKLKLRIKELEEREKILMEALEFYADEKNWFTVDFNNQRTLNKAINEDDLDDRDSYFKRVFGGKKARETLKQLGEK